MNEAFDPAYDEYSTDEYPPDWKARAKLVRDRDNYTCQHCGVMSTRVDDVFFHVDHIIPKSDGGSHSRTNLQALCPACHAEKHPDNSQLAQQARTWQRRNQRSVVRRLLRVLLIVPLVLDLFRNRPRTVSDEHGRTLTLTPLPAIKTMPKGEGISLDARVKTLWDNDSDSIQQVGLLAPPNSDDGGVIKFVAWADNGLPELREGDRYRLIGALTDEYNDKMQVGLDRQSKIQSLK